MNTDTLSDKSIEDGEIDIDDDIDIEAEIASIKSPQSDTPSTDSDEKLTRNELIEQSTGLTTQKKGKIPILNVLFPELAKIGTKKYLPRCEDKQEYYEEDLERLTEPRIGRYLNRTGVDGLFTRYKTGRPSCYKGKKEKVEREPGIIKKVANKARNKISSVTRSAISSGQTRREQIFKTLKKTADKIRKSIPTKKRKKEYPGVKNIPSAPKKKLVIPEPGTIKASAPGSGRRPKKTNRKVTYENPVYVADNETLSPIIYEPLRGRDTLPWSDHDSPENPGYYTSTSSISESPYGSQGNQGYNTYDGSNTEDSNNMSPGFENPLNVGLEQIPSRKTSSTSTNNTIESGSEFSDPTPSQYNTQSTRPSHTPSNDNIFQLINLIIKTEYDYLHKN